MITYATLTPRTVTPSPNSTSKRQPADSSFRRGQVSGGANCRVAVRINQTVAAEMSRRNSTINSDDDFTSIFAYQLSTVGRSAAIPLSHTASGTPAIGCSYSSSRRRQASRTQQPLGLSMRLIPASWNNANRNTFPRLRNERSLLAINR